MCNYIDLNRRKNKFNQLYKYRRVKLNINLRDLIMKKNKISNNFHNDGCLIYSKKQNILDLKKKDIIQIFEKYGIIIFRNFNIDINKYFKFAQKFTKNFANDAQRRKSRDENKNIHEVDYGNNEMALHSEASFSPTWPEIVWFYCNEIEDNSEGQTTFCDGIKLWDNLSLEEKNFFQKNPIKYSLEVPIKKNKKLNKKKWFINSIGSGDALIDWKKGIFKVNQIRFAINPSRIPNKLAFSNHTLYKNTDETIKKWGLINDRQIPKKILDKIRKISDKLIYKHHWKKRDLIMLDNKRFMHGRSAYKKSYKRDILNIQTAESNFGYGETTK